MDSECTVSSRAIQFRRTHVSARTNTVNAMAAMVRSHTSPVLPDVTNQLSTNPDSDTPFSRQCRTNHHIG